jgi:hypothetical protein
MRLFIDYDLYRSPFGDLLPNEAYELIRAEITHLKTRFNLGRVTVYRSLGGFQVRFERDLTDGEMQAVLPCVKYGDRGYFWWVTQKGLESYLRTSEKKIVKTIKGQRVGTRSEPKPELWEVL